MSDAMPRAPMSPAAWRVACPGCERDTDIADHDWREDDSGAFEAVDAARFPVCEYCGLQFEVTPVTLAEAAHDTVSAGASSDASARESRRLGGQAPPAEPTPTQEPHDA